MKSRVLCIEDDLTIQTLVEESLREFWVTNVSTLKEAEELLSTTEFSAILIDIQLPDGDGLRFLSKIVGDANLKKIPALILSNHSDISNKVMAFSLGAEDFVGKPFDPIELRARVSAKIKRSREELQGAEEKRIGDLVIDIGRQKAFWWSGNKENDLRLTSIELKILVLLTKRMEQVYSRNQIMDQVWGETFISDRTVDSHVAHLRQKIQPTLVSIETSKNFGYCAVLKESRKAN